MQEAQLIHSGLGVASFVLAVAVLFVLAALTLMIAGLAGAGVAPDQTVTSVMQFMFFASLAAAIAAIGLGVFGRGHILGILGLIFGAIETAVILIVSIALIVSV
ncbi:MAG: hypothetical protein LBP89_02715 [Helicobacteraceae bacterium]|jgi:hypothetical protein|nr:hypothetical protein [Helicobacteraceae bacterium]